MNKCDKCGAPHPLIMQPFLTNEELITNAEVALSEENGALIRENTRLRDELTVLNAVHKVRLKEVENLRWNVDDLRARLLACERERHGLGGGT